MATTTTNYNAAELLRVFFMNRGQDVTISQAVKQSRFRNQGVTPRSDAIGALVDANLIFRVARGTYRLV